VNGLYGQIFLTVCFCFKLCCDGSQNTSQGGMTTSNDDDDENKPLTGNDGNKESPGTNEMSRFKF